MSIDALFFSPHPDDVELFCGATVAALAEHCGGQRVCLADMTQGEMSSNGSVEERAREAATAAAALGVQSPREQLGLPDAALDANDAAQLRAVVGLVRRLRPRLIFAPWTEDRHPDHVATGELVRRAMEVSGLPGFASEGVPFRPDKLLHYPCHAAVEPDVLVDVGQWLEAWEEAVGAYASQFGPVDGGTPTPINHPGFLDLHRGRRVRWGERIGVGFAEGFVVDGAWALSPGQLLDGPAGF